MEGFDAAARTFVRGEGCYLFDIRGHRVFDAVSSIWTSVHGHCRPEIIDAIAAQAGELDHATLLGASNPRAEELAAALARLLDLDRVFFASDGASAVEAALKMVLQFWQHREQPARTRFVRLVDAYHGDTAGAMSVSDIGVFKARYGAVTFETRPYAGDANLLHESDVAAVIVEPIVQAAAGMRIVPAHRYAPLRDMEPLLIVDEIATGFGRTGTMFAHEQLGLAPDVVCVGKGLTGGTLALSATAVKERVYEAFLGAPEEQKQFFHGHSYAGNPIACAAALANLRIFERDATLARAADTIESIRDDLADLAADARVRDVRGAGLMIGIELQDRAQAVRAAERLYDAGFFTRPIGPVVQLVPPLTSAPQELRAFLAALKDAIA